MHARRSAPSASRAQPRPPGSHWRDTPPPNTSPLSESGRVGLRIACHACGYGPGEAPAGGVCPKCGCHSWDRFLLRERLLPAGGLAG